MNAKLCLHLSLRSTAQVIPPEAWRTQPCGPGRPYLHILPLFAISANNRRQSEGLQRTFNSSVVFRIKQQEETSISVGDLFLGEGGRRWRRLRLQHRAQLNKPRSNFPIYSSHFNISHESVTQCCAFVFLSSSYTCLIFFALCWPAKLSGIIQTNSSSLSSGLLSSGLLSSCLLSSCLLSPSHWEPG